MQRRIVFPNSGQGQGHWTAMVLKKRNFQKQIVFKCMEISLKSVSMPESTRWLKHHFSQQQATSHTLENMDRDLKLPCLNQAFIGLRNIDTSLSLFSKSVSKVCYVFWVNRLSASYIFSSGFQLIVFLQHPNYWRVVSKRAKKK